MKTSILSLETLAMESVVALAMVEDDTNVGSNDTDSGF
jgi:hypothetical protein